MIFMSITNVFLPEVDKSTNVFSAVGLSVATWVSSFTALPFYFILFGFVLMCI